jgi:hypothetical protein
MASYLASLKQRYAAIIYTAIHTLMLKLRIREVNPNIILLITIDSTTIITLALNLAVSTNKT